MMAIHLNVILIYINKFIAAKQHVSPILPFGVSSGCDDLAGDADVVGRGLRSPGRGVAGTTRG